jgi:intracellular multiplication protein IcmP
MVAESPEEGLTGPAGFIAALLAVVLIFLAWLWLTHHDLVVGGMLALRGTELRAIAFFDPGYASLAESLHRRDPSSIGLFNLYRLGVLVGAAYHRVAALGLAALAVVAFVWAPSQRYRRKLNLAGLILGQHDRFRTSRAFVGRNRILRKPAFGQLPEPGDVSLHADEWIAAFGRNGNGEYSDEVAEASLVGQLGKRWTGVHAADPHVRCLFAAFALQAERRRDEACALLGDLAVSLPPGNGEIPLSLPRHIVAEAESILAETEVVRRCAEVAARHAYTTTAMMGVLKFARQRSGILNPGQFNWLKLVDRNLWYALVWPPNPYTEAGGAQDHYNAEIEAGRPLVLPNVGRALDAIRVHRGKMQGAVTEGTRAR